MKDKIQIFVDGSYLTSLNKAGWGFVVILNDEVIYEDCGLTILEACSRQIDGEIEAAKMAMLWLKDSEYNEATICYDYLGVEHWYTGKWKAKKRMSISYRRFCDNMKQYINLDFIHTRGHSGNKWNDYADKLAEKGKNCKKYL